MFENIQQQLRAYWGKQTFGQRIVIIVLTVVGAVLFYIFINWANSPSFSVAYTGVSEADAGQIVERLESAGIPYQLQGSGTIQVPSDRVYETRMLMAKEGLPTAEGMGFEIFNGNTIGMTSFSQEVNYQQALEAELERTIGSMAAINAVRVHIVTPERSLLSGDQAPTTASVIVDINGSSHLDTNQVQSITHLVSSGVEGLTPQNVVVADIHGNLLAAGQGPDGASSASQVDNRRAAELAAAASIKNKVQAILDSALGPNRAVVQAAVSMDWTEKEVVTQSYDPDTAAVRSSQTITESYSSSDQLPEGVPGAESNLPDEVAENTSSAEGLAYQRQEETTNYELTQTEILESFPAGEIQNISLSVLVDGVSDAAQMASLTSAIAAAAGIDESRGDVMAVETISFDRSFYESQEEDLQSSEKIDQYFEIGKNAAVVLGVIIVFWYIMQTLKRIRIKSTQAWTPVYQSVGALTGANQGRPGLPNGSPQIQLNKGPEGAASSQPALQAAGQSLAAAAAAMPALQASQAAAAPQFDGASATEIQNLTQQLGTSNPAEIADVVRMWINEG